MTMTSQPGPAYMAVSDQFSIAPPLVGLGLSDTPFTTGLINGSSSLLSDTLFQYIPVGSTGLTGIPHLWIQGDLVASGQAVPLIQGYNLQISGFDNGMAFGNTGAVFSLCNTLADGGGNYRTLRFEDSGNLSIYGATGTILWTGNITVSDMRLKKDIKPVQHVESSTNPQRISTPVKPVG